MDVIPWQLYLFIILEITWVLFWFDAFGFTSAATCRYIKGNECISTEHMILTFDSYWSFYSVAPFLFMLVRRSRHDENGFKGLANLAFCMTLLQLGGLFYTVSNAFNGGFVPSAVHLVLVLVHLFMLWLLHEASVAFGDELPPAASMWSGLKGFTPKAFLLLTVFFVVLFLIDNTDVGDYDSMFDTGGDENVTEYFVNLWNWFNVICMNAILVYLYAIIYGTRNDQAWTTALVVIWNVVSAVATVLYNAPIPSVYLIGYLVAMAISVVLGGWALYKHNKDRESYESVPAVEADV